MRLEDMKNAENDAKIQDYIALGLKKKPLPKAQQNKLREAGFPESACYKYERVANLATKERAKKEEDTYAVGENVEEQEEESQQSQW